MKENRDKDYESGCIVFILLTLWIITMCGACSYEEDLKKVKSENKELKKDIETNLKAQNEHRATEKYKDDLVKEIVKKSKIPAPAILIDDQLRIIRDDMTRNAESQGMTLEDYVKTSGETMENWEKEAKKVAETRVKASLALQTIAVENKITVSDDLVNAKIAELRDVYKNSPEAIKSLKDPNVKMDIKNRMIIEETLNFLVKNN